MFVHFFLTRRFKLAYKVLIHYSDDEQLIFFYFSGPKFNKRNMQYFKNNFLGKAYLKNAVDYEGGKINKEIYEVYNNKIKKKLTKVLERLLKSGRDGFSLIFAGNSLAGSLATLAAYDIKKNYKDIIFYNLLC